MMKPLDEINNRNPFRVPENYFGEVNRKIFSATVESIPEPRKQGLYRRLRPALAIAASVAVLVMLGYSAVRLSEYSHHKKVLSGISTEDLSLMYLNDANIYALEENAEVTHFPNREAVATQSEIIDYLLFEDIDVNEIFEIL